MQAKETNILLSQNISNSKRIWKENKQTKQYRIPHNREPYGTVTTNSTSDIVSALSMPGKQNWAGSEMCIHLQNDMQHH